MKILKMKYLKPKKIPKKLICFLKLFSLFFRLESKLEYKALAG